MCACERNQDFRAANRTIFERSRSFEGNMPLHLRISLLESCNLRCYMCPLTALPEELRGDLDGELMTLDAFDRLAEDAFPYADRVTFGFAGEPTLHPQFSEFLKRARGYGIEVEVYSNGTTLHKDSVAEAIAEYADWLVVSLDGAEEETFAMLRGGASLRSIEASICAIRERARTLDRSRPLRLAAHTTMMRSNIEQLAAVVEKAHRLEMERISSAHIGIFDGNLKEESLFEFRDLADRCLLQATERAKELGIEADFPPRFCDSNDARPVERFYCHQLHYSIIVLSNGDVLPCCHASARWRLVMGNLQKARLPDIWYGYRFDLLRASVEKGDLPIACRDCANNNPYMDLTTEWELESFSKQAAQYEKNAESIRVLERFEKELYLQQQAALVQAMEEEERIDARFERIRELESSVDARFSLESVFREQRGPSVKEFGCTAYPPSNHSINRRLNRSLYERGEAFQGNLPLHVEMSIVAGCNIQCIMCVLTHLPEEERRELLHRRMDRDAYIRFANQLFPYAESIFFGIGGEPTIHSDFCDFVRIAHEAGLDVHVSSNGTAFADGELAQTCVDRVRRIIVSMDGATKETFERIRKGAKWERVLAGIRELVERRQTSETSRLRLSINFTLMKDTIEEFPDMVNLAHELGVDELMAEHLIATLPELEEQSLFDDRERSDRCIREAIRRAERLGVRMEVPDLFDMERSVEELTPGVVRNIRSKESKKDVPFCSQLKYSVVIAPTGEILPCSHPDAQYQFRMGTLNGRTFQDIWFGSEYQKIREVGDGEIPPLCKNCSMCGRSDGLIPAHERREVPVRSSNGNGRCIFPQTFAPRRIQFIDRLMEDNRKIHTHVAVLRDLGDRMGQHENNLQEIVAANLGAADRAAELTWIDPPPKATSGNAHFTFCVRVRNAGREAWPDGASESDGSVMIGGAFYRNGERAAYMDGWGALPHPLGFNQTAEIVIQTNALALEPGRYRLKVDAVKLAAGFFEEFGSKPLEWDFEVTLADESEQLWRKAIPRCTNLWSLSQGTRQGRTGKYPLFAAASEGSRITDMEGATFLDYVMGWGTATLGYNHPAVREAVASVLSVGPTLPLPHSLQVEVAEKLCSFLPCGERVLFGKNGSDVLEAAVRIARAHTGKERVLCCGYHGFHDWFAAALDGVEGTARADRELVHSFPYGDPDFLHSLLDRHHDEIAAVVMEPASMAYPPEGYLETVRQWTEDRGIVLVFDEIMSAFRLANGGAQEKYGVYPDLAAVGKGIANGLPLAALAGRRSVMDRVFNVGYGPTFHGEVYALAAANAALDVYANEAVCERICATGDALERGIAKYARRYGIGLETTGVAPRLVFEFQAAGRYTPAHLRTYFLQELLECGILCGGTLLPSYAHSDGDVRQTLKAVKAIFKSMKRLIARDKLMDEIRIPLHVLYLGERS